MNPNAVCEFDIIKNGKKRHIVSYADNPDGNNLRKEHENLLNKLSSYVPNKHSYAYFKNKLIKSAIEEHNKSNVFIKLDVHHFFESIIYDSFINSPNSYVSKLEKKDFECAFYDGRLPTGFETSPVLSDIYLNVFDCEIEKYLLKNPGLFYTRYADDILLSSTDFDFERLHLLKEFVIKKLNNLGLSINETKTKEVNLYRSTSIKYLGLNISKGTDGNKITVTKRFILKLINLINEYKKINEEYKKINNDYEHHKEHLYLKRMCALQDIINGNYQYIKFNSKTSYKRFLKKYKNAFGEDFSEDNLWLRLKK